MVGSGEVCWGQEWFVLVRQVWHGKSGRGKLWFCWVWCVEVRQVRCVALGFGKFGFGESWFGMAGVENTRKEN